MTEAQLLNMYKEKKWFVKNISDIFAQGVHGSDVTKIVYEVYTLPSKLDGRPFNTEFIVVHFKSGAFAPVEVTGNSNSANFRAIGNLLEGGNYDTVDRYNMISNAAGEPIEL